MMNRTQTSLPPGLALGIAANQAASQGQFWERTPDGNPTVTAKNLAAVSQRDVAQQARTAQQIEAMKMAQMQQAIQQMAAKQASSPMASGIGALPGDVASRQGMAEGGVVGYSGKDDSAVEIDETKLPVSERFRRTIERALQRRDALKRMMSPPAVNSALVPVATSAIEASPQTPVSMTPQQREVFSPPNVTQAPAPAPTERKKPAPTSTPARTTIPDYLLDTRDIPPPPSESSVQAAEAERIARESAEQQRKPRVKTQEEIAADAEQRRLTETGLAALETQRQRFESADQARKAALKDQPMENLISRLTRVGGAGSLFRGLGQAQLGMEPIIAGQRAAEQTANEKKIQYFDLLDQRKDAVERFNLAWLQKNAEKAMAESARIRGIDADLAKTLTTLKSDQAKQLLTGEQAEKRTKMEIDARAIENEKARKATAALQSLPSFEQTQARKAMDDWLTKNPGKTFSDAWEWYRSAAKGGSALTANQLVTIQSRAERQASKDLESDLGYMKIKDPVEKEAYRKRYVEGLVRDQLAMAGYEMPDAQAPAPVSLPPEVLSKLKEGTVTTFANGQKWTMQNGKPVQVK